MRLSHLLVLPVLLFTLGCGAQELPPPITDCAADHPMVGASAELETYAHDAAGTAVIVDNCTIEIRDFHFDGGGVDVHVVVADNADFDDFTNLTEDLRPDGPYEGSTLTVPLREGMSLDEFTHISIWCLPFSANFGDGVFELPPIL